MCFVFSWYKNKQSRNRLLTNGSGDEIPTPELKKMDSMVTPARGKTVRKKWTKRLGLGGEAVATTQ